MTQKLQIKVSNKFDNVIKILNFCLSKGYTILDIDAIDDVYLKHTTTKKELGLHFNGAELTMAIDEEDLVEAIEFPMDLKQFIHNNCQEVKK